MSSCYPNADGPPIYLKHATIDKLRYCQLIGPPTPVDPTPGGTAPSNASYVLVNANPALPNARVLEPAGPYGVTVTDLGMGSTLELALANTISIGTNVITTASPSGGLIVGQNGVTGTQFRRALVVGENTVTGSLFESFVSGQFNVIAAETTHRALITGDGNILEAGSGPNNEGCFMLANGCIIRSGGRVYSGAMVHGYRNEVFGIIGTGSLLTGQDNVVSAGTTMFGTFIGGHTSTYGSSMTGTFAFAENTQVGTGSALNHSAIITSAGAIENGRGTTTGSFSFGYASGHCTNSQSTLICAGPGPTTVDDPTSSFYNASNEGKWNFQENGLGIASVVTIIGGTTEAEGGITRFRDRRPLCSSVDLPVTLDDHLVNKAYVDSLVAPTLDISPFGVPISGLYITSYVETTDVSSDNIGLYPDTAVANKIYNTNFITADYQWLENSKATSYYPIQGGETIGMPPFASVHRITFNVTFAAEVTGSTDETRSFGVMIRNQAGGYVHHAVTQVTKIDLSSGGAWVNISTECIYKSDNAFPQSLTFHVFTSNANIGDTITKSKTTMSIVCLNPAP